MKQTNEPGKCSANDLPCSSSECQTVLLYVLRNVASQSVLIIMDIPAAERKKPTKPLVQISVFFLSSGKLAGQRRSGGRRGGAGPGGLIRSSPVCGAGGRLPTERLLSKVLQGSAPSPPSRWGKAALFQR